jgi:hypothetical protein
VGFQIDPTLIPAAQPELHIVQEVLALKHHPTADLEAEIASRREGESSDAAVH